MNYTKLQIYSLYQLLIYLSKLNCNYLCSCGFKIIYNLQTILPYIESIEQERQEIINNKKYENNIDEINQELIILGEQQIKENINIHFFEFNEIKNLEIQYNYIEILYNWTKY